MSVSRQDRRKEKQNTKKQKQKKMLLLLGAFVLNICSSICMVYSLSLLGDIETKARILITISIILLALGFTLGCISSFTNKKSKGLLIFIITLLYSIIMFTGGGYIFKTYKVLDNITTDGTTYSSSLIALKDDKANKIDDIGSGTIGMLSDTTSVDGNQIPTEIISQKKLSNKVKTYDDYPAMLTDFYASKVDYIFVPTNYSVSFKQLDDKYEKIKEETKVLFSKEKRIKNQVSASGKKITEPFTVLLMGVDSEKENIKGASFNGDALMVLTFNPTTLNTTILSIPRDSYVPIACFPNQLKNKITHAAAYGESCMINTIQNFTGIDIDYYVKINFKGVVKLIDKLGGVEVDVPYSFCEQDSARRFGSHMLYVEKGKRVLNGEEALALSRNRKTHSDICSSKWTNGVRNDFVRGQNQQLVLRSLLNKMKSVNNLNTIYSLLDTISNNMETNMQTSEILSLYNVGKDIIVRSRNEDVDKLIGFQRLYLNGRDARIYDPRSGLNLYNYVLYDNSVSAVVDAMEVNLGKKNPTFIKSFSFDATVKYEETVIGKREVGNLFGTTQSEINNTNSSNNNSNTTSSNQGTKPKQQTTTKTPSKNTNTNTNTGITTNPSTDNNSSSNPSEGVGDGNQEGSTDTDIDLPPEVIPPA